MKKLLFLIVVGTVLILTACDNSRGTTTVCTTAPSWVMPSAGNITVTIESLNGELVTWTERITTTPLEYGLFFWGFELYNDEIEYAFELYAEPIDGISWNLISISGNTLVFEATVHYDSLTDAEISEIWGINSAQVTLTTATRSLEVQGATCRTN